MPGLRGNLGGLLDRFDEDRCRGLIEARRADEIGDELGHLRPRLLLVGDRTLQLGEVFSEAGGDGDKAAVGEIAEMQRALLGLVEMTASRGERAAADDAGLEEATGIHA